MPSTVVANIAEGPAVKRQKVNGVAQSGGKQATQSRIFTPFRVCGAQAHVYTIHTN